MWGLVNLQPASLAHIEALIAGDEVFAVEFGLRVIPGYLAFPEALEHTRKQLAEGMDPNWWSHLIVDPGPVSSWGSAATRGHRSTGRSRSAMASLRSGKSGVSPRRPAAARRGVTLPYHPTLKHTRAWGCAARRPVTEPPPHPPVGGLLCAA